MPSATGDAENVACGFLIFISSSDEHSEHTKWSNFFASSIVMPTQAGWYLQKTYKDWNMCSIEDIETLNIKRMWFLDTLDFNSFTVHMEVKSTKFCVYHEFGNLHLQYFINII